jgi:hypothetical protein
MENGQISLQIAALVSQTFLDALTGVVREYFKRKVFRFYQLWKYLAFFIHDREKDQIRENVLRVRETLNRLFKVFGFRMKIVKYKSFLDLKENFKSFLNQKFFLSIDHRLQEKYHNEIQSIDRIIKQQQNKNDLLEKQMKKLKDREYFFRERIQETSERLIKKKKMEKDKEEENNERILELKDENSELKEKIEIIDNNINNFLGEVKGLFEISDEGSRKNLRRTSLRKNK